MVLTGEIVECLRNSIDWGKLGCLLNGIDRGKCGVLTEWY